MNHFLSGATLSSMQEVEAVCLPGSESRIVENLTLFLGEFGKINSVSFMPPSIDGGMEELVFFVNFEKSDAAMSAANSLDCILYGFSTVVVRIPRGAVHAEPA